MKCRYISTYFDGPLQIQKDRNISTYYLFLFFLGDFYSLLSVDLRCYCTLFLIYIIYLVVPHVNFDMILLPHIRDI